MTGRRLPLGIQTLRKIREDGCYYVDKTAYLRRLVDEGTHYFLSRPRRFGKSLFVDTLKELFEGNEAEVGLSGRNVRAVDTLKELFEDNEELFRELAVHDRWDWSVRHPVLRLSFGGGAFRDSGGLHANVMAQLGDIEREAGAESDCTTAPERFRALLGALHRDTGQGVAVLVDEYDSLDMAVRFERQVYLFEFKVVELAPEGAAMAQLKARRYADKYRGLGVPIHLIGVEFSRETRNVAAFEVERA